MPELNLCDIDSYYKKPYVSDASNDKLRGLPSSVQDIYILKYLTDDAILDLGSLASCDLYNIASISVQFVTVIGTGGYISNPALILRNGSNLEIKPKSGDPSDWIIRHEDYDIANTYSIGLIESKRNTKIEGQLHLLELQTEQVSINNGAIQGTFIEARNVDITGSYCYIKNANITCSFANIISNKARIDNTTIICQQYLQDSPDSSLLNCNIIAATGKLNNGYIVSSQFTFNRLNLISGYVSSTLLYDESLYGFSTFSGISISASGNNFLSSGIPPITMENTATNKNFQLEVPLLVINGVTPLNGTISTTLLSGSTPQISIGIDGNITTDYISGGCINSGLLNIDTIINDKLVSIINYGELNCNTLYSNNRLQLTNASGAVTNFEAPQAIFHKPFVNSGVINANNLYTNVTTNNNGVLNASYIDLTEVINYGLIKCEDGVLRSSSENRGLIECATMSFTDGSINANKIKGQVTFLAGSSKSFNGLNGLLEEAIFLHKNYNQGYCRNAIFKGVSENLGIVNFANFYDNAINGATREAGALGTVTVANFYNTSINIGNNSLWERLSFYDRSLNGATLSPDTAETDTIRQIIFQDNSYNTGIIRGSDKLNLEFLNFAFNSGNIVSGIFRNHSSNFKTVTSGAFLNNSICSGNIRDIDPNYQPNKFCIFKNSSSNIGASVLRNCQFYDNSFNNSNGGPYSYAENEDVKFYNNSINRGKISNVSFFDATQNYGTINGDIVFSGVGTVNFGTITEGRSPTNVKFYSSSTNRGSMNGIAEVLFSGNAYNAAPINTQLDNADIIFVDRCINHGSISALQSTVKFDDSSATTGYIETRLCGFSKNSVNFGSINITAGFATEDQPAQCYLSDTSINKGFIVSPLTILLSGSVNDNQIFGTKVMLQNGSQNNQLISAGSTSFEYASTNNRTILGSGIFDTYSSNNGVVSGNAVFTNYSSNQGVVVGTAEFDVTSVNNGTVLGLDL
jgi:hypothetical protein